jgi:hypothetical protein
MTQIIEIAFTENTSEYWGEYYNGFEKAMIVELAKRNIEPKDVLFRGIKYSDLGRALRTGNDLKGNEIYAGAIGSGQHNIRTALEYGYHKGSRGLFSNLIRGFAITCYEKRYFEKKEFFENLTYLNYRWALKEGINFRDALRVIFLFKRTS